MIQRRLNEEMPFMATENMIMSMVHKGFDRQEVHENIRVHSHEAGRVVKRGGKDNDLIDRVLGDAYFAPIHAEMETLLDLKSFIGRAKEQVEEFTAPGGQVSRVLEPYRKKMNVNGNSIGAEMHV